MSKNRKYELNSSADRRGFTTRQQQLSSRWWKDYLNFNYSLGAVESKEAEDLRRLDKAANTALSPEARHELYLRARWAELVSQRGEATEGLVSTIMGACADTGLNLLQGKDFSAVLLSRDVDKTPTIYLTSIVLDQGAGKHREPNFDDSIGAPNDFVHMEAFRLSGAPKGLGPVSLAAFEHVVANELDIVTPATPRIPLDLDAEDPSNELLEATALRLPWMKKVTDEYVGRISQVGKLSLVVPVGVGNA